MSANKHILIPVYACAVMLNAAAQANEIQDIAWNSESQAQHRFVLLPGKFAELCGKIKEGEEVMWSFEATQPADFNIHYHAGKKVVEPVSLKKVEQTGGSITAASTQDYCWMWTNTSRDKPARLEVKLDKRVP
jgi:hypothetical protein